MTTGIYLSAMTPHAEKSLIALGLADTLVRRSDRIGFFRPVFNGETPGDDPLVRLMRRTFDLPESRARGGVSLSRCRELLAAGNLEEMSTTAVGVYSELAAECDVIIVDGTDLLAHNAATAEFDMNATFAKDLGCAVVAVVGAHEADVEDVLNAVEVARAELLAAKVDLLSVMVNRADPALRQEIAERVARGASQRPVYVLPEMPEIAHPTVAEVVSALGLEAGHYDEDSLDRDIHDLKVAAMTVGNYLSQLSDGDFVIVPGDRTDIVVGSLASALSPTYPVPSGMLLTGGLAGDGSGVLQGLLQAAPFPVLSTEKDTFTAAHEVGNVSGALVHGRPRKISAALGEWARTVDEKELVERLELPRPATMTPLRFLHQLIEKARADRKKIVLPEGEDIRVLRAAERIQRRSFCDLVVLGNEEQILEAAQKDGLDLDLSSGIEIVDPTTSDRREAYAQKYAELRSHKGITLENARDKMTDPSYFGTMMVFLGEVDGMVSGASHTTANTIRPSLEFVKTKPGVKIVSSVFFMLLEDRTLVYGDCAVNPNPHAEQLADIARASAETARQFGVEPRVAMLSYSTGGSGAGEDVEVVKEATRLVRESGPDFQVEGPIQYDAATNASIAASKLPESQVAGKATVFVFPDLNTGNNTYKAVQQSSGAVAVGPVLQGLRKPVNDLSRGCTVEDIVNTVAITAIQAQGE